MIVMITDCGLKIFIRTLGTWTQQHSRTGRLVNIQNCSDMSDVSSTEYLRLIKFSFDTSSNVLKAYTNTKLIVPQYGGSFIRFLDKNKHEFYHKWQSRIACCMCKNNLVPKDGEMPQWIFEKVYEIQSGIKCSQQRKNGLKAHLCLCRVLSKQNITLYEMDVSVINFFLKQTSLSNSDTENIITMRNELCHAWSTEQFEKVECENIWNTLERATLSLASQVEQTYPKLIKDLIKTTRKYDVDKEEETKLREEIRSQIIQLQEVQTDTISKFKTELAETFSTGMIDLKRDVADICKHESEMDRSHTSEEACRIISETNKCFSSLKNEQQGLTEKLDLLSKQKDLYDVGRTCTGEIMQSILTAQNKVETTIEGECKKMNSSMNEAMTKRIQEVREDIASNKRKRKKDDERALKVMKTTAAATQTKIFDAKEDITKEVQHQSKIGQEHLLQIKEEIVNEVVGQITRQISTQFQTFISMSLAHRSDMENRNVHSQISMQSHAESTSWKEESTIKNLEEDLSKSGIDDATNDNDSEFKIESIKQKCIELVLSASCDVFSSSDNLKKAIQLFIERLIKAGEIDTNATGSLHVSLRVKSRLTQEEKDVVYAVFSPSTLGEGRLNKFETKLHVDDESNIEHSSDDSTISISEDKNIKKEYDSHSDTVKLYIDVQNLNFIVHVDSIPQYESSEELTDKEDISSYVEWIWNCPSDWEVMLLVDKLKSNMSMLRDWFTLDYPYSDAKRRLVLQTNTPRHVLLLSSSLKAAARSFLEKVVDVCDLETGKKQKIEIEIKILFSVQESTSDRDFGAKADTNYKGMARTFDDVIVICAHCTKNFRFRCKKCIEKEMTIRRLMEANQMKESALAKLEPGVIPELEHKASRKDRDKDFLKEPEQTDCTKDSADRSDTSVYTKDASESKKMTEKVIALETLQDKIQTLKWKSRDINFMISHLKNVKSNKYMNKTNHSIETAKINDDDLYTLRCSLCKTSNADSIMAWCDECNTFLCNSCVLIHNGHEILHAENYEEKYMSSNKFIEIKGAPNDLNILNIKAIQCVNFSTIIVLVQQSLLVQCLVFGIDGNKKLDIDLSRNEPYFERGFIVPINDYTVVTAFGSSCLWDIIDYTNGQKVKSIPIVMVGKITGVAYACNQLFIGFHRGIDILNISGTWQRRIVLSDVQVLRQLGIGKLYCRHKKASSSDIISTCFDITNNTTSELKDFKYDITDVIADDEGNIIFIQNDMICLADKSGQNGKVIVTGNDIKRDFKYISCENSSGTLIVSNTTSIFFYTLLPNPQFMEVLEVSQRAALAKPSG